MPSHTFQGLSQALVNALDENSNATLLLTYENQFVYQVPHCIVRLGRQYKVMSSTYYGTRSLIVL